MTKTTRPHAFGPLGALLGATALGLAGDGFRPGLGRRPHQDRRDRRSPGDCRRVDPAGRPDGRRRDQRQGRRRRPQDRNHHLRQPLFLGGFGSRLPARGQRGQGQHRHRQLHQRSRAGAGALGLAPEDAVRHAGRCLQRNQQERPCRLREEQIHLPRLSDLGRAGAVGVRRRQGTAGGPEAHEDRGHHERGRRLDQAARRRLRGVPAQDRPQGARPYPLLARHHRLHPDLQQDRGRQARRDHHRHFACRRAADGAMEEPAGADPDVRHQLAGHQRDLRQGHQRRRRRRALSGRFRSGRRGDAEVDPVRRRLQEEVRQLSVLCRLYLV